MSEEHPLVSVIIPAYNHAKYVHEALISVEKQSYNNIEIIVIDDHSIDGTPHVVQDFARTTARRMKYARNARNCGLCSTLNRALELCSGDYISFLASDDVFVVEKTDKQVSVVSELPQDYAGCYSDLEEIDEEGSRIRTVSVDPGEAEHHLFLEILLFRKHVPLQSLMLRSEVQRSVGEFNSEITFEDWEYSLRVTREWKLQYIPEALTKYRKTAGGLRYQLPDLESEIQTVLEKYLRDERAICYGRNRIRSSALRYIAAKHYSRGSFGKSLMRSLQAWSLDPSNGAAANLFARSSVKLLLPTARRRFVEER